MAGLVCSAGQCLAMASKQHPVFISGTVTPGWSTSPGATAWAQVIHGTPLNPLCAWHHTDPPPSSFPVQAIHEYGSDAMRWALADAGDGLDDANFETTTANAAILRLTKELAWCEEVLAPGSGGCRMAKVFCRGSLSLKGSTNQGGGSTNHDVTVWSWVFRSPQGAT